MTRKESGWLYVAMQLADEMVASAARETFMPGGFMVARHAMQEHLTSLQSAAEGLEEATVKALSWLCDERQGTWQYMEGSAIYSDMDALKNHLRTALSAFNAIKGK